MPTAVPHNISIADLHAAGLRLRPVEAVTIARELTLRAHRGELPGIPSASVLRFTSDGDTVCEGPVAAGQSVERAGRLLESLLPGFDAPPEFRVPGALRLVVARSLGTLDLPAYTTLDGFADALARFATDDMATVVRGLVRTWRAAVDAAEVATASEVSLPLAAPDSFELTVSDVRRARRATGLRLAEISERSRIPVSLLRELEWGYFANWPTDKYGRTHLVRYAKAAGLDAEVVIRAVWPLLEDSLQTRTAQAAALPVTLSDEGLEENENVVAETRLARLEPAFLQTRETRERRPLWLAALAIPALLAIGFVPAAWQTRMKSAEQPLEQRAARNAPAAPVAPRSQESTESATPETATPNAPAAVATPSSPSATDAQSEARAAAPQVAQKSTEGPVPANQAANRADLPSDDVAYSPTFASVGSAMFYHADGGDRSALMRADTDTSGAVLRVTRIVDDNAKNFHARPSPDGELIAFDSDRDGERGVYVADAHGRNVRRVSGEGYASVPSWSPDGRTLAFVRAERDRPRVWNIWTTNLDSGETRRVTSHRIGTPWGAAWFPDGRRIAYSHEDRLILRSLQTGAERVFQTPRKGRLIRTPAVSPDGRLVMFQVHRDGAWLLDVATGAMRKVLSDATAEEFAWSPDGRRVAYHSRKAGGWGVWMMAAR